MCPCRRRSGRPCRPRRKRKSAPKSSSRAKDPEGAAAPPNLKASPTQIVAPPREVRLELPSPIIAAPVAGPGSEASAGASTRPGPGTGAGGEGTGLGSGARGTGTGGGGGGGVATRARWIGGGLRDSDYPCSTPDPCVGGTVFVRLRITEKGRVGACAVTRSSGDATLDRATCRLIQERLRYRPARDAWGRRVPDTVPAEHEWNLRAAPDRWVEPDVVVEE